MIKILFVCTGNICRSPTADGVLALMVKQRNLDTVIEIDSAGIERYHVGEKPDLRSIQAAKTRGYDLEQLRARQIGPTDFKTFDLILAMDQGHFKQLQRACPAQERHKIHLFLEFSSRFPNQSVPDPYYGAWDDFISVLDMVEDGCEGLLAHIETELLD